jgi:hypothetical protein
MRRAGLMLVAAALIPLAACRTEFEAYGTTPLPLNEGVTEAGPRVAVCYNALSTPQPRVAELAQQQCAADRVARPLTTDWHLQVCPLLLPSRANFVCAPKQGS